MDVFSYLYVQYTVSFFKLVNLSLAVAVVRRQMSP